MASSSNVSPPPIIIVKKKGHHGHHGGAWKVAYADFVTAMMALFIVLWLMSSSEEVKKAVGGYFQDPTGQGKLTGTTQAGVGEGLSVSKDDMTQLRDQIQKAMEQLPKFEEFKNNVQMILTSEGLRIELMENEKGMFFDSGSPRPTDSCQEMLGLLAQQLGKLPNKLMVEGHTDAKPFSGSGQYTNWELSADRANSARRVLQAMGVPPSQIGQIRGFADQRLRSKDPLDPSNRRVSIIVQYIEPKAPQPPAVAKAHANPRH
jgi:chemotaxis protein MotB